MVAMFVARAFGSECDNYVGFFFADEAHDFLFHLCLISLIELAIHVAEEMNGRDAQESSSGARFIFADTAKLFGSRSQPGSAARLPARCDDDRDSRARPRILRNRAARPERFIVRMRQHEH